MLVKVFHAGDVPSLDLDHADAAMKNMIMVLHFTLIMWMLMK